MLKLVYEGQLDSFVKSTTVLDAGTLVRLNAADPTVVEIAGAGDPIHGILAHDVIAANINNFQLGNVVMKSRVGEKCGVFIQDGVYITDKFSGTITAGSLLYPGASGLLSATASGTAIGVALETKTAAAGVTLRFKFNGR